MTCIVCGKSLIGHQKKFCSKQCNNRFHRLKRVYVKKPLTPEEQTQRGYAAAETRRRNMMKEVPDKMILTIHEIIGRRLKNPAQLISVAGIFKLMLKKTNTPKAQNHVLNEALYYYIYEKLEDAGGALTGFKTTSGTRRKWTGPMRAVFRFPPLKERMR